MVSFDGEPVVDASSSLVIEDVVECCARDSRRSLSSLFRLLRSLRACFSAFRASFSCGVSLTGFDLLVDASVFVVETGVGLGESCEIVGVSLVALFTQRSS